MKQSKQKKVLIVEDDTLIQKINETFLKKLHCQVDIAGTGAEALEKTSRKKYDLILLDIGLPDTTGLIVCRNIRNQELNKDVCIVFLTAYGQLPKKEAIKAGGNTYLVKPAGITELAKLIKGLDDQPPASKG